MRCFGSHIEYPLVRRMDLQSQPFPGRCGFLQAGLRLSVSAAETGQEEQVTQHTMELWRVLIYEALNVWGWNGLFLYSQHPGSSLKDVDCCIVSTGVWALASGFSCDNHLVPLSCTCRPAQLPVVVQPETKHSWSLPDHENKWLGSTFIHFREGLPKTDSSSSVQ